MGNAPHATVRIVPARELQAGQRGITANVKTICTEEASLRVLSEHLTGDDLTLVRRLFKHITKWYRVRSCEHCGVFHGDVGLRYCRDCFAAELLTGRREDYTVLNLGSRLRAEAIAQIANLKTL